MALSPVDALVIQLIDAIRAQVLGELKGMSLNDLLRVAGGDAASAPAPALKRGPGRPKKTASAAAPAPRAPRPGRRVRRTLDDIKRVAGKVAALLGDHADGLTSEQIQKTLGIAKKELTGPIALALSDGTITKSGERRATRYYAKGRGKKKAD